MKKSIVLWILIFLTATSCTMLDFGNTNVEGAVQTAVAQTQVVNDMIATAFVLTQAAEQPTEEPAKPETETPLPTATAQPAVITATLNANTNCRTGPDGAFELVVLLNQGTSVTMIGKNEGTTPWFKVELSDGSLCWVVGERLTFAGNTDNLPVAASDPIPTSFYSPWVGTWTVWQNQCTNNSSDCENVFAVTYMMTSPTTLMGSYVTGGCTFLDVLTLSADQMRADGFESSTDCGGNWDIHLVMDPGMNQFRGRWNFGGNTSADGYYCGARNGAGKPDPTRP